MLEDAFTGYQVHFSPDEIWKFYRALPIYDKIPRLYPNHNLERNDQVLI